MLAVGEDRRGSSSCRTERAAEPEAALLEQRLRRADAMELFWERLARQRPKPRTRSAAQDERQHHTHRVLRLFELDLDHLVGLAAAGRRHLDDVVLALAEKGTRYRRGD